MPIAARPVRLHGRTYKIGTGHGVLDITINRAADGRMVEVFGFQGKAGSCQRAELEALARLVSLALRSGVLVADLVDQLKGIQCGEPVWYEGRQVLSLADAMAQVLALASQETDYHQSPSP